MVFEADRLIKEYDPEAKIIIYSAMGQSEMNKKAKDLS